MTHYLKINSPFFSAVDRGDKKFEVRFDDRGYQKGDIVVLSEIDAETMEYSGRALTAEITYVTSYMQQPGYIVFSFNLMRDA
jgi:hypothetical protein